MRIAIFSNTYQPQVNGVSNTLEYLGAYLEKVETPHMFFVPEYPERPKYLTEKNITRFRSIPFLLYAECRIAIPLYYNLRKALDRFRPDIIHLCDPFGICQSGLRYAKAKNIPVVASFHTNFDQHTRYYKLDFLEDTAWTIFKWFHKNSRINFCPSTSTMEQLKTHGIGNLRLWSRGIDTVRFSPKHRDGAFRKKFAPGGEMLFLYTGRIAAEKDLDILMDSIIRINAKHPGKANFVFVGDGPAAEQLKKQSPGNVYFTGYLKGYDLSVAYASCDAFVFPSTTETFGNVVLEAMASGLPVVATAAGGVKDSLIDGYNGIACKPRDTADFTAAIEAMLIDREAAAEMGRNARGFSKKKSWDNIFDTLVADYHSVMDTKSVQGSLGVQSVQGTMSIRRVQGNTVVQHVIGDTGIRHARIIPHVQGNTGIRHTQSIPHIRGIRGIHDGNKKD